MAVLRHADPELKRTVYDELGVRLTYHPDGQVHVEADQPHVLGVGFPPQRGGGLIGDSTGSVQAARSCSAAARSARIAS